MQCKGPAQGREPITGLTEAQLDPANPTGHTATAAASDAGAMGKARKPRNFATFRLYPRAGAVDASDRVFVRVDNNPYSVPGFAGDDDNLSAAAGDGQLSPTEGALPEHVRREILELGLPDDGYNYLHHLRELRPSASSSGGGASAAFLPSHRARFELPLDVKAYDASRVRIDSNGVAGEFDVGRTISEVAAETAAVKRVEGAVDRDIAKLLEENDALPGGSKDEGLEEDFVILANQLDGEEVEGERTAVFSDTEEDKVQHGCVKGRARRLLREQFDMLAFKEYANSEDDDCGVRDVEYELPPKVIDEVKLFQGENVDVDDEYKTPADFVCQKVESSTKEEIDESANVIQKCTKYAERYFNESKEEDHVVLVSESNNESEVWDCETILSTYSNLNNQPGKIQHPEILKGSCPEFSLEKQL